MLVCMFITCVSVCLCVSVCVEEGGGGLQLSLRIYSPTLLPYILFITMLNVYSK